MTAAPIARMLFRLTGRSSTVPVILGLGNIYILPTGYGLLYLVVLVAMLIGSINYNNNLGFLLSFLLGSLGLTAMMHTYSMLFGLRLSAAAAAPVFAGEALEVEILVSGADRPRTNTCWNFKSNEPVEVDIKPGEAMWIRASALSDRRGYFDPGRLRIACEYPLGFFRAWARINTGVQGLVYPKPIAAPVPDSNTPSAHGAMEIDRRAGVDDFVGLSTYQPGDSPRRIHWQAFSRGRGLHTKTFAGQAGDAELMLDLSQANGDDVEEKLSSLCFQVLWAHHQRRSYGLNLAGTIISGGNGRGHRDRCLRELALCGERPAS